MDALEDQIPVSLTRRRFSEAGHVPDFIERS